MSNNMGVVGNLLRCLLAVGGDNLLAVLNDVNINNSLTESLLDLSWCVNRDLLAPLLWDTCVYRSRLGMTG